MTTAAPAHAPTAHQKLRPSGGYRQTASFQTTTLIYDATWRFCESFLDARSRTVDQMVQAARSGRQNIAEGSRASATSSQTELRLLNVARASLEELLLDYEDFLRHRRIAQWAPDSADARTVRAVAKRFRPDPSDPSDLSDPERWSHYARWLEHAEAGVRANAIICLIHQANYLLDRQIASLEEACVEGGGYTEHLAAERLRRRKENRTDRSDPTDRSDRSELPPAPACPACGSPMARRTAKTGKTAGKPFWGCTRYPDCKGTAAA